MGLIDLIRLAFSKDDEIFIPLDNEYTCDTEGDCIWEREEEICEINISNVYKIKELVSNGLPKKPNGEAPRFELNNGVS